MRLRQSSGAAACALALPLAALVLHPVSPMGISDESPYVRQAEVLARTGHFTLNGWAAPFLGWHLYLGALIMHLFGYSFGAARTATVLEGMLLAALLEDVFERCGIRRSLAVLGTLTLTLSPLWLPLTFSYMSDIGGVLALVLCLWMCLRALSASTATRQAAWVVAAALVNAVAGTVRQTGWVGVLVVVPCTLWLLRRNRQAVWGGALSVLVSIGFIVALTAWMGRQPYAISESGFHHSLNRAGIYNALVGIAKFAFFMPLLLIPVLTLFATQWRRLSRKQWLAAAVGFTLLVALCRAHVFGLALLQPWMVTGSWTTPAALAGTNLPMGLPPLLPYKLRAALALLTLALVTMAAVVAFSLRRSAGSLSQHRQGISSHDVLVLLGPAAVANALLMLPRAAGTLTFDRYDLPLSVFVCAGLLWVYEGYATISGELVAYGVLALVVAGDVSLVHDRFAALRGEQAAIDTVLAQGVPRNLIDGEFPYNAITQLDAMGYMNDPHVRNPPGAYHPTPKGPIDDLCPRDEALLAAVPAVHSVYRLSYSAHMCGKASRPSATYHQWLGRHTVMLYIVKAAPWPPLPDSPAQPSATSRPPAKSPAPPATP